MKSLSDIKQDMSDLYDSLRAGAIETQTASELANIAGKFLKAEQLDLAREIFTSVQSRGLANIGKRTALIEHTHQ